MSMEVVKQVYDAFDDGDMDRILSLMSDSLLACDAVECSAP